MASALGFMRGLRSRIGRISSKRVPFWRSMIRRRKRRSMGGMTRRRVSIFPRRHIARRIPAGMALAFGRGSMKSPAKVMSGKATARSNPWIKYLKNAVKMHYRGGDYPSFVQQVAEEYRRTH